MENLQPDRQIEDGGTPDKAPSVSRESLTRLDHARSLTRLIVGGTQVGLDELLRFLQIWEERAAREAAAPPPQGEVIDGDAHPASTHPETNLDLFRYALVGWLFETQGMVADSRNSLHSIEKLVGKLASPVTRPVSALSRSRLFSPLRRHYDRWVERGEAVVDRWIELGRSEDSHSRSLARIAFDETIDQYIEYLTNNPEVQDLVEKQSSGLANEVIDEVRERTVSADTFLESIMRSLLRRMPRRSLPEPPREVRERAINLHAPKTRRKA